jgi:lipopolysaccharide biosynthesis glycosyltransferase
LNEKIRLLFAANEAYAMPMTVAAHSALYHLDKTRHSEVNIFSDGISTESRARVHRSLSKAHPTAEVRWHYPKKENFIGINVRRYSQASLCRLLAPNLFDVDVERVLYLDSDLVVETDISPLWDMSLGSYPLWAVQNGPDEDFENLIAAKFPSILSSHSDRYFNSGVLLINLSEWRLQQISEKCLDFLHQNSELLSFPDQDALNAVAHGNWGRLSMHWNKQVIQLNQPESAPFHQLGILHFTSNKPWHRSYTWPGYMRFHRAYLRSGWQPGTLAFAKVAKLATYQFLNRGIMRTRRKLHTLLGKYGIN